LLFAGVNAYYLLKGTHKEFAKIGFATAMLAILILAPVQILVGDFHGLNVAHHQPVKLAAMEGIWKTEKGAALRLFAIPDQENETNHFELSIPKAASFLITHDVDGEIAGLDQVEEKDRPQVAVVFTAFRVMLGLGGLMLLLGLMGAVARYKKRLFDFKPLLYLSVVMIPSGVIATLAGWYVVEVGRQPWLVQGLVRTADVISPLPAETVAFTLGLFVVVYSSLFFTYLYFMRKLILKGPPSLDAVQASLINPLLDDNDDFPATLNPAQVDVGYGQELSEYLHKQDKQPQDKGEK
jgi:cytochrome d ubiquinol oxidase subunit I